MSVLCRLTRQLKGLAACQSEEAPSKGHRTARPGQTRPRGVADSVRKRGDWPPRKKQSEENEEDEGIQEEGHARDFRKQTPRAQKRRDRQTDWVMRPGEGNGV